MHLIVIMAGRDGSQSDDGSQIVVCQAMADGAGSISRGTKHYLHFYPIFAPAPENRQS